jgi:hypothetical protein
VALREETDDKLLVAGLLATEGPRKPRLVRLRAPMLGSLATIG